MKNRFRFPKFRSGRVSRIGPLEVSAALLMALGMTAARAACPSVPTASRFSINIAGDEVTDSKTALVWARCSVGQSWNGSACTGTGTESYLTHQAALQHAAAQTGWRLPNVKELSSLMDEGCQNPVIDSAAFPNTPSTWFWSSSPYMSFTGVARGVDFGDGGVVNGGRGNAYAVRLVRASQ